MSDNSTKLKAAGLWQKTSAAGNTYFVGRLGGVRILIFDIGGDARPALSATPRTGRERRLIA